eukprot:scaffold78128_cov63-Phaeocystis_antarctica.AAC.1
MAKVGAAAVRGLPTPGEGPNSLRLAVRAAAPPARTTACRRADAAGGSASASVATPGPCPVPAACAAAVIRRAARAAGRAAAACRSSAAASPRSLVADSPFGGSATSARVPRCRWKAATASVAARRVAMAHRRRARG